MGRRVILGWGIFLVISGIFLVSCDNESILKTAVEREIAREEAEIENPGDETKEKPTPEPTTEPTTGPTPDPSTDPAPDPTPVPTPYLVPEEIRNLFPKKMKPLKSGTIVGFVLPGQEAKNVEPTTNILVMFTGQVDVKTLKPENIRVISRSGEEADFTLIPAILKPKSHQIMGVLLDPVSPLDTNSIYRVLVSSKIQLQKGNSINASFDWKFTTGNKKLINPTGF